MSRIVQWTEFKNSEVTDQMEEFSQNITQKDN